MVAWRRRLVCRGLERGGRARPASRDHERAVDPPRLCVFRRLCRLRRGGAHDPRLCCRRPGSGRCHGVGADASGQDLVLDGLAPGLEVLDGQTERVLAQRRLRDRRQQALNVEAWLLAIEPGGCADARVRETCLVPLAGRGIAPGLREQAGGRALGAAAHMTEVGEGARRPPEPPVQYELSGRARNRKPATAMIERRSVTSRDQQDGRNVLEHREELIVAPPTLLELTVAAPGHR